MQSFFAVAPSVEITKTTDNVVEGTNITLFCNASGKPKPSITWRKVGSSEVLSYTSVLTVLNVRRPGTPDSMIQYQCTTSNGVESPVTARANVNVQCKSMLLSFLCSLHGCKTLVMLLSGRCQVIKQ